MVQSFGTDSNNDLYLNSNGSVAVLDKANGVQAACLNVAKGQLGEMVLATKKGIPNFQVLWNGTPNLATYESYLRRSLKNVDGVVDVKSLLTQIKSDVLSYTAVIESQFGDVALNGG